MDVDCAEIREHCVVATKYNGAGRRGSTAQQTVLYCCEGKGKVCIVYNAHHTHRTNYFNIQMKEDQFFDFSIFHFSFLV